MGFVDVGFVGVGLPDVGLLVAFGSAPDFGGLDVGGGVGAMEV